jgi:biotin carboxyl carrier protein
MNYIGLVQGVRRAVSVRRLGPGRYQVVVDGRDYAVELAADAGPEAWDARLHLQLADRSVRVDVGTSSPEDGLQLVFGGRTAQVQVLGLREMQALEARAASADSAGPAAVAAPMAGRVVSVLVQEGDRVEAGQGLLVVEAMKMENELRAPQAGTVRNLQAAVGGAIRSGTVVCTVT